MALLLEGFRMVETDICMRVVEERAVWTVHRSLTDAASDGFSVLACTERYPVAYIRC